MLENAANETIPIVRSLDASYEAAQVQGSRNRARFIIDRVTRKASEFVKTPVEGDPAPIVTPEV